MVRLDLAGSRAWCQCSLLPVVAVLWSVALWSRSPLCALGVELVRTVEVEEAGIGGTPGVCSSSKLKTSMRSSSSMFGEGSAAMTSSICLVSILSVGSLGS